MVVFGWMLLFPRLFQTFVPTPPTKFVGLHSPPGGPFNFRRAIFKCHGTEPSVFFNLVWGNPESPSFSLDAKNAICTGAGAFVLCLCGLGCCL